jgi:single-strand DNA-binding protein
MSLNHIVIMGRMTRDPELRRTGSGIAVASFCLAVDRDFNPKDGGEKETDFIDCTAWRSTGEFVSKYFTKGSMAIVSGRLQIRTRTDKDGNKRRNAEVVADNVYFGESRKSQEGNSTYHSQNGYQGDSGGFSNTEALINELMAQKGQGDFYMLEDGDPQLPF